MTTVAGSRSRSTLGSRGWRPPLSRRGLAVSLGLGVNAGHDLNLDNLPRFVTIPGIQEVSIGHALVVECLELGINTVVRQYLAICQQGH